MVSRRFARRGGFAAIVLMSLGGAASAAATTNGSACADVLPDDRTSEAVRPVGPLDLVRLRDIGMNEQSLPGTSPLAISPDGHRVAFQIRRADPDRNTYCQAMVVMPLRPGAAPIAVDTGGELVTYVIPNLRGISVPTGTPDVIEPFWSADGRWIAYRKRVDGHTQAWIAKSDGGGAHALTALDDDVEALAWSADGRSLTVETHRYRAARDRIAAEGRDGFLFDDRIVPMAGASPFPAQPIQPAYFTVDVENGDVRAATGEETARLSASQPGRPPQAALFAAPADGRRIAWTQQRDPRRSLSPADLWVRIGERRPMRCSVASCQGKIVGLWWSRNGRELRYLRRTGWADSLFTLYQWRPGMADPKPVAETADVLTDCQPTGNRLLCDRDATDQPRRIVLLDPKTGRMQTLFDPNPEYEGLTLGAVRRLHWRTDLGMPVFGDLVLPVGYRTGERYPLVIVQYRTKGFLRGGVGDEYPIQAFAARGYAVLSVERPAYAAEWAAATDDKRTDAELSRTDTQGWADRRNNLSEILNGIKLVEGMRVADPEKIGITGMSDGAMSAIFALDASPIFKAAALSSCCLDPKTTMLVGGTGWTRHLEDEGYPEPEAEDPTFWKPMSLAMNADHVRTPVLMQLADDEYMLGLEAASALRAARVPVELRVFPGEHHVKSQPAHRLAIYRRNLDWFDFWLLGKTDPDADPDQYARWRTMDVLSRRIGPLAGSKTSTVN